MTEEDSERNPPSTTSGQAQKDSPQEQADERSVSEEEESSIPQWRVWKRFKTQSADQDVNQYKRDILSMKNVEEVEWGIIRDTHEEVKQGHKERLQVLSTLSDRAFKLIQTNGVILGILITLSGRNSLSGLFSNSFVLLGIALLILSLILAFIGALQQSTSLGIKTENVPKILTAENDDFESYKQFKLWLVLAYYRNLSINDNVIQKRGRLVDLSMFAFLLGSILLIIGGSIFYLSL